MTVAELLAELKTYVDMGMGDEPVTLAVGGHYADPDRTEPGDGLEGVYLLDKGSV